MTHPIPKPYQSNNTTAQPPSDALPQHDFDARVTAKILSDLEKGELSWRKPWNAEHLAGQVMRPLRWNNVPYTGINTILLWATAAERGYSSPYWMTFHQATDMKAFVRKGEKATTVVYADKLEKEEKEANGSISIQKIPFLKQYSVFNVSQIEGLPESYYKLPQQPIISPEKRIEALEQFFAYTKAQVFTGSQAAYYIGPDRIEMPPFESFNDAASFYATFAHEITHWTRHASRLNRDFNRKKWGDDGYAQEELVAELGACFLGADLGFEPITKENHAAYIQCWLNALRNDKRFIFQAASFAQKAVEYVMALQPTEARVEAAPTPLGPQLKTNCK